MSDNENIFGFGAILDKPLKSSVCVELYTWFIGLPGAVTKAAVVDSEYVGVKP